MFRCINVFVLFSRCELFWTDIRIGYWFQYAYCAGLELGIEPDATFREVQYPHARQSENPPLPEPTIMFGLTGFSLTLLVIAEILWWLLVGKYVMRWWRKRNQPKPKWNPHQWD